MRSWCVPYPELLHVGSFSASYPWGKDEAQRGRGCSMGGCSALTCLWQACTLLCAVCVCSCDQVMWILISDGKQATGEPPAYSVALFQQTKLPCVRFAQRLQGTLQIVVASRAERARAVIPCEPPQPPVPGKAVLGREAGRPQSRARCWPRKRRSSACAQIAFCPEVRALGTCW